MKINIKSPKNLGSFHTYSHSRLKVRSPTRPLGTGGQIRIKSRPGAELYTTILVIYCTQSRRQQNYMQTHRRHTKLPITQRHTKLHSSENRNVRSNEIVQRDSFQNQRHFICENPKIQFPYGSICLLPILVLQINLKNQHLKHIK